MKNFLKISLLATVLLTSLGAYANDNNFSLTKGENEKSVVFLIKETQDIQVSIFGYGDEVLYEKNIHALKGSSRTYDLSAFPDGTYTFELRTDDEIATYQIAIENDKATVSIPTITEIFKPTLTKVRDIITLNLENVLQEPVEVKIIDENNDQVYYKVFDAKSLVNKKFNINKSDSRELTFIVKSKNQEYIKVIDLR